MNQSRMLMGENRLSLDFLAGRNSSNLYSSRVLKFLLAIDVSS